MKTIAILCILLTYTCATAQVVKQHSFEMDGNSYVYEYVRHPEIHEKYIRTMRLDGDTTSLEVTVLSQMNPDLFEGLFIRYDDAGRVLEKGEYSKHRKTGSWVYYFANGGIRERHNYNVGEGLDIEFLFEEVFDSLGNAVVVNGNGLCPEYIGLDTRKNNIDVMHGSVVDGYKHGIWKGAIIKYKDQYEERWNMGRLLSGLRTDSVGNEVRYTKISVQPEAQGGVAAFHQHVSQTMKYPAQARRLGIEGRVFVEFIVEKDGSVSGVRVIRGIGGGCDEEAVKVVKSFNRWVPGAVRGRKVRNRMVVPLVFKLR